MMKLFVSSTTVLIFFSQVAGAQVPGASCASIREARVTVEVSRNHWVLENGNYQLREDVVCTDQANVSVIQGSAGGCISKNVSQCLIELDGTKYKLNSSAMLVERSTANGPEKHFSAGYHLDRNIGSLTTGEASFVEAHTSDTSPKKMSLDLQSKLDTPMNGHSTRDGFSITVNFEDSDAP